MAESCFTRVGRQRLRQASGTLEPLICKHHEGGSAAFASGWSQVGCEKPEASSSSNFPNRTSKWVSTPSAMGSWQIWHLSFPRDRRLEINSESSVGEAHTVFSTLLRPHAGQSNVTVQPNQ